MKLWIACGLLAALAGCGEGDLIGCPPNPGTYHMVLRVTKNEGCTLKAQTVETDVTISEGEESCGVQQVSGSGPVDPTTGCQATCLQTTNVQRNSITGEVACSLRCPEGTCRYWMSGSFAP